MTKTHCELLVCCQMTELATSRDMPENRQTLLFSATFPPNLLSMLPSILRTPYFRVDVGKSSARLRDETAIIQVFAHFWGGFGSHSGM